MTKQMICLVRLKWTHIALEKFFTFDGALEFYRIIGLEMAAQWHWRGVWCLRWVLLLLIHWLLWNFETTTWPLINNGVGYSSWRSWSFTSIMSSSSLKVEYLAITSPPPQAFECGAWKIIKQVPFLTNLDVTNRPQCKFPRTFKLFYLEEFRKVSTELQSVSTHYNWQKLMSIFFSQKWNAVKLVTTTGSQLIQW